MTRPRARPEHHTSIIICECEVSENAFFLWPAQGATRMMYAAAQLETLIDHYMSTRRKPSIISTKAAARAITTFMSPCPLSGRDFENAIAGCAVKYGHVVAFDFAEIMDARFRTSAQTRTT